MNLLHADLLAVATEAAVGAAAIIRTAVETVSSLTWEMKGTADFVTEVDRDAEACICGIIRNAYPDASIVGEELSPHGGLVTDGITFVVDPLDGTTNFLHRYPQYAVSIGVVADGELTAGVVLNAANGELFTATRNGGAFLNGGCISVSSTDSPGRALIGTGFPFKRHDLLEEYSRQFVAVNLQTAGIRRAGAAALDLADVACGRFDGFWELDLAPWDIAAGCLLIREARGIVTRLDGRDAAISPGPVVAGNPYIHEWLLTVIAASSNRPNIS